MISPRRGNYHLARFARRARFAREARCAREARFARLNFKKKVSSAQHSQITPTCLSRKLVVIHRGDMIFLANQPIGELLFFHAFFSAKKKCTHLELFCNAWHVSANFIMFTPPYRCRADRLGELDFDIRMVDSGQT